MQGFNNPFFNGNMGNNFNNINNGFLFPNQNQMMPQQLIAGNWTQMYSTNQPNFDNLNMINNMNNMNNMNNVTNKKISVIFKTGKGLIFTVFIDFGKTVNYLIRVFFKRIGKPELINKPKEIGFIYNAKLINFNESQLVEDFFGGLSNVTITVNDIGDLIGA